MSIKLLKNTLLLVLAGLALSYYFVNYIEIDKPLSKNSQFYFGFENSSEVSKSYLILRGLFAKEDSIVFSLKQIEAITLGLAIKETQSPYENLTCEFDDCYILILGGAFDGINQKHPEYLSRFDLMLKSADYNTMIPAYLANNPESQLNYHDLLMASRAYLSNGLKDKKFDIYGYIEKVRLLISQADDLKSKYYFMRLFKDALILADMSGLSAKKIPLLHSKEVSLDLALSLNVIGYHDYLLRIKKDAKRDGLKTNNQIDAIVKVNSSVNDVASWLYQSNPYRNGFRKSANIDIHKRVAGNRTEIGINYPEFLLTKRYEIISCRNLTDEVYKLIVENNRRAFTKKEH